MNNAHLTMLSRISNRLVAIKELPIAQLELRQPMLVDVLVNLVDYHTDNGKLTDGSWCVTAQDYWPMLLLGRLDFLDYSELLYRLLILLVCCFAGLLLCRMLAGIVLIVVQTKKTFYAGLTLFAGSISTTGTSTPVCTL